jgi:hypothetical protein
LTHSVFFNYRALHKRKIHIASQVEKSFSSQCFWRDSSARFCVRRFLHQTLRLGPSGHLLKQFCFESHNDGVIRIQRCFFSAVSDSAKFKKITYLIIYIILVCSCSIRIGFLYIFNFKAAVKILKLNICLAPSYFHILGCRRQRGISFCDVANSDE